MKELKALSVVLAILFAGFIDGSAQTFKPGLFGGIVTSQVGGDSYTGFNKLGVTFGGFVRYDLSENWSTQFEIAFVQKGSRNNFSISENDPNQTNELFILRLNYVEIPLLFKFSHNNFVYEGGLYYARLVSFYMEYYNGYSTSGPYQNLDDFNARVQALGLTKLVRNWDFGGMLGVGYKITDNLLGSIRISNSLVAIKEFESGKVDHYPTSFRIGWTNTALLGTIRYTFGEGDEKHVSHKPQVDQDY